MRMNHEAMERQEGPLKKQLATLLCPLSRPARWENRRRRVTYHKVVWNTPAAGVIRGTRRTWTWRL